MMRYPYPLLFAAAIGIIICLHGLFVGYLQRKNPHYKPIWKIARKDYDLRLLGFLLLIAVVIISLAINYFRQ